jgi:hypothetical protein
MGNCTPCGSLGMFNKEHVNKEQGARDFCPLDALEFQLALELHLVGVEKLGHKQPSDLRHE